MSRTYFYSHLIQIEPVIILLGKLELTDEQKIELAGLIDSIVHHSVMDCVLSKLEEADRGVFLEMFSASEDDELLMEFLKEKDDNIEDEIAAVSSAIQAEFERDIKEAAENIKLVS